MNVRNLLMREPCSTENLVLEPPRMQTSRSQVCTDFDFLHDIFDFCQDECEDYASRDWTLRRTMISDICNEIWTFEEIIARSAMILSKKTRKVHWEFLSDQLSLCWFLVCRRAYFFTRSSSVQRYRVIDMTHILMGVWKSKKLMIWIAALHWPNLFDLNEIRMTWRKVTRKII